MSEKDNNKCSLSEVCIKSITVPLWRAHYNSKETIETIKEDFKNLSNNIHLTNTKLWGEYGNLKKTIETIQKDFENLNNELKPDNIDSNISSADIFSDETHIYDSMSI
ncbi:hypothetical protein [Wolbachia endosymbiont (group B) of Ischnura elegans]|uniref:hypothetical protein n=1 Tax=Wolbachia endosymbiont (group B) of Ischnura elegans TaxID=2954021 RepID=UPI00222F81BC|nr:hypothetical protein [Wolbachia endosymbiont (group B) of Ischnura elegans]